ncbi:MAG: sulfite exporter TauE/SafE family protein [Alicyclobacillus shizuokensis]|nr:sulfite exporter TauE/SafE family protein [Alicyclobacillus shizuokensis]
MVERFRNSVLVATGLTGGLASGLLGLGGAFLFIPPLMSFAGLPRHRAHATTVGVMFFTSLGAVVQSFFNDQSISLSALIAPALGAALGVAVGTRIMNRLSERLLGTLFAAFLILSSVDLWIVGSVDWRPITATTNLDLMLISGLIGLFAGLVSGALSVGSGSIVIPLAVTLLGVSQLTAQALSLTVMMSVSFVGGLLHWKRQTLQRDICMWVSVGGVCGGIVGMKVATLIPESFLHLLLVFSLAAIGVSQFMSSRRMSKGERKHDSSAGTQV